MASDEAVNRDFGGASPSGIWANSQAWLSAIVDSSDDAIIGKTLDSIIRSWNRAASRIFGYEPREIIGQPVTALMPPELRFEEPQIVARLVRGERVEHFETVRVRKDGRRIDVSLSVSPIRDGEGQIVGAAKIARDVTEAKRVHRAEHELVQQLQDLTVELEQQLEESQTLQDNLERVNQDQIESLKRAEGSRREAEEARREADAARRLADEARRVAEEANMAKGQFVAKVSHEFRTPLNAITGYVELLELQIRGPITDAQREDLGRIRRSADMLRRLIDDVLNFAKLESGHVEFHYEAVALDRFLSQLESFIAPRVERKGLQYRFDPDGADITVWIDQAKVQQVMLNFLSNAVKFTDKGSITLRCRTARDTFALQVADTGRGIPPDSRESIFEPFVQGDNGTTTPAEGTGLGLAISRELARAMGGDVTVESEDGKGSTFSLVLPR